MVVDRLYSSHVAERFREVELILGCGDLPYEYLEFLVTSLNVPCLYVPGNHDPAYDEKVPAGHACGCENMDRQVCTVKGLNIAGLGGSIRYRPGVPNQYTQSQMTSRVTAFTPRLRLYLLRHRKVLDVMLAHSPPLGTHDDSDQAHTGFSAFLSLIQTVRPRYFLHGHTALYKNNIVSPVTMLGTTTVINVYPYRLIDIEV